MENKPNDLKESLRRHMELLNYDPAKGKSSLNEKKDRHKYLMTEDEPEEGTGNDDFDFNFTGDDEGGEKKEGGDDLEFSEKDAEDTGEGEGNDDFDFGGGEEEGNALNFSGEDTEEDVDEFGTADEFSAADDIESGDSDVEEIDVTDIVKRADDAKSYAEKAVSASEEGKNMIKDLMSKFDALQQSLSAIDTVKDEVTSIKKDIQAQKPKEKLELRSLDSYPFNVKLTDYWNDEKLKDNYEVVAGAESTDGQVKAWKLEPEDTTNYNQGDIKNSFIPESKRRKRRI